MQRWIVTWLILWHAVIDADANPIDQQQTPRQLDKPDSIEETIKNKQNNQTKREIKRTETMWACFDDRQLAVFPNLSPRQRVKIMKPVAQTFLHMDDYWMSHAQVITAAHLVFRITAGKIVWIDHAGIRTVDLTKPGCLVQPQHTSELSVLACLSFATAIWWPNVPLHRLVWLYNDTATGSIQSIGCQPVF